MQFLKLEHALNKLATGDAVNGPFYQTAGDFEVFLTAEQAAQLAKMILERSNDKSKPE
jgi:hypothetical protein